MTIDERYNRYLVRLFLSFVRNANRVSWFVSGKNVQIDAFSYETPKILTYTDKYRLVIGKFCSIAFNVRILVDLNHETDWISTNPFGEKIYELPRLSPEEACGKGDMVIGNDVWIGQDTLIVWAYRSAMEP